MRLATSLHMPVFRTVAITTAALVFTAASPAHAVPGHAIAIDSSVDHTCAVTNCGDVVCWGDDYQGHSADQLVTSGWFVFTPPKWDRISVARTHSCAVNEDDQAYCWGGNDHGQLDLPVSTNVYEVAAGIDVSCVLTYDGEVQCVGASPQDEVPPHQFVDISAGPRLGCGVTTDGGLVCWGARAAHNGLALVTMPPLALPNHEFIEVDVAVSSTCALTNYGMVYCTQSWYTAQQPEAWTPVGPTLWQRTGSYDELFANMDGACALDQGVPDCWGPNIFAWVDPPAGVVDQVSIGNLFVCELDTLGEVTCRYNAEHQSSVVAIPDEMTGEACPYDGPFEPVVPLPWGNW